MDLKAFSIFDVKAQVYSPPFNFKQTGEAKRAFADLANDLGTDIGKHPEDYTLFMISTFDRNTAEVIAEQAPVALGSALEYIKSPDLPTHPQAVNG